MTAVTIGVLGIILFLVIIILGMPIALGMSLVGIFGYASLTSFKAAFSMIGMDLFASVNSYSLSVIGMYTLMGYFALHSGIGAGLFDFAYKMIGHWPGGLAMASEFSCAAFGAVCGSGPATTSTIASIACPEMKRKGYKPELYTGSVAAGGGLGLLIPPSITAIIYGTMTGTSIGKLFIAGVGAGLLLCGCFCLLIFILVKRDPELAPQGPRFSMSERVKTLGGGLLEVLIIFFASIAGLTTGLFTPTESGAAGAFMVLAVVLIRRKLTWRGFLSSLYDTARTIGMVLLLVACATTFGRFIALAQIPAAVVNFCDGFSDNGYVILLIVGIVYLIAGCFIDSLPMLMITIPIFYPVIVTAYGFDAVWFGIFCTMVCLMGMITPPVGIDAYVCKAVNPDVPLTTVFKLIWWFVLTIMICIIAVTVFPQIILFLPNLMG
ncbi:MAG: TRAP transporter large permease [Gracilibacteraceae bacterium]|jgi:tripartite ATP-independent transporter DctM subunit|nr:TRAP transporter large permease [Gracilibacteraceae bacterium]